MTPWLWGLLPDNDAVLARWARQFHASASSPFLVLATQVGGDCAGAVQFVAPDNAERLLQHKGDVTWLSEDEVGERLRELEADSTAWLGKSFTGQFSLAGAQAKTALLFQDGRWGIPPGATPTSHILKSAVAGLDDHDLNEHRCLDAARRAGLIVARTRVRCFGDESAIVVDRYDRVRVHEKKLRLAMKLGGHYDVFTDRNPWPRTADELGVDEDRLTARVAELAARAPDAFADAATTCEVTGLGRDLPHRLVDLVSERVRRCIALLGVSGEMASSI